VIGRCLEGVISAGVGGEDRTGGWCILIRFEGAFIVSGHTEGWIADVDALIAEEFEGAGGAFAGKIGFQGSDDHENRDESFSNGGGGVELFLEADQLYLVLLEK